MQVKDVMARHPRAANPAMSLREAAALMDETDAGMLPVSDGGRLVGVRMERDVRRQAGALNRPVRFAMTPGVQFRYEDDDAGAARRMMQQLKLRRLAVLTRDERLIGMLSDGDDRSAARPDGERQTH